MELPLDLSADKQGYTLLIPQPLLTRPQGSGCCLLAKSCPTVMVPKDVDALKKGLDNVMEKMISQVTSQDD